MEEPKQIYGNVLDRGYIGQTSRAIAQAIRDGVPIEVNFQPGDGSRYELVFVPIHDIRVAPPRVARIQGLDDGPHQWDAHCSFGVSRVLGATLIAWKDHGATALDLSHGGWHPGYLSGLFERAGNCEALGALVEAIAEEM
jgi:hypothetical protein